MNGNNETIFYLSQPFGQTGELPCPVCNSALYLRKVEITHLLVHDPHGKVAGSEFSRFNGTKGNRYSPACDRGKKAVAEGKKLRSLTTMMEATTCFECRAYAEQAKHLGHAESGLWLPAGVDEIID